MAKKLRLGVNIDHVATIRNARGGVHPDPVKAALIAANAGANGITAHLREDRRHISDKDIIRLKKLIPLPLNLEMAATEEMLKIALKTKPHAACIVPEKRREVTTEGGLDVVGQFSLLNEYIRALQKAKIRVSLFIDPDKDQIHASALAGADIVELHTGKYCKLTGKAQKIELERLKRGAEQALALQLECHAGHGLSFDNVKPIAAIPQIVELNIGHFLIGEAVFMGLVPAIRKMRKLMNEARR
jgi:pyridoxine 5-phosphate synthase